MKAAEVTADAYEKAVSNRKSGAMLGHARAVTSAQLSRGILLIGHQLTDTEQDLASNP